MEFIDTKTIKLDKPLNELDKFVLNFISILKKHVDYVIISGYVSILLGRSRATEDVDVFIKPMAKDAFVELYHQLKKNGFWCLNAESDDEVFSYLEEGMAIRFAEKEKAIPNMEVKFARKFLDLTSFSDAVEVRTRGGTMRISSLERQIAFKRFYLKSDKDLEDARHLEEVFKDKIDHQKIKEYKKMIEKGNDYK